MSFDDLAFPGFGARQVSRRCPSCEEVRQVGADDWTCPSCGERLLDAVGDARAATNPMLAQLLHQTMAAAAASSSPDEGGDEAVGSADGLSSQLQSMFIPSLNSTYMDMVRAQQGISIDELMTQLLQNESLQAPPTSKRFIESLVERELETADFIQLYLRFPDTLERDIFPTVATFGVGQRYVHKHAEAQKKQQEAAAAAETAPPADDASASSSVSPAASASVAPITADDDEKPPSPPQEHASGPLVASNPLSVKSPLNARLFRGSWILAERGVVSFVAKARTAQDAMARGLIVAQTEPDEKAWPFTMSDTTGAGRDIVVPVLMVSRTDAQALQTAMKQRKEKAQTVTVQVMTRGQFSAIDVTALHQTKRGRLLALRIHSRLFSLAFPPLLASLQSVLSRAACVATTTVWARRRSSFRVTTSTAMVRRPRARRQRRAWLSHPILGRVSTHRSAVLTPPFFLLFPGCITPWLQKRANCPLCRFALPTDAPKTTEDLRGPDSNHAQLQRDMFT